MKNHFISTSLAGLLLASTGNAAPAKNVSQAAEPADTVEVPRKVHVELHPLSAIVGTYGGQVRFAVSEGATLGFSAARIDYERFFDEAYTGYSAGLEAAFALNGSSFTNGWAFRPTLGYVSYEATDGFFVMDSNRYVGNFHGLYAGASMAYQWIYQNGMTIALGGGATIYSIRRKQDLADSHGSVRNTSLLFSGVNPMVVGNIGIVF